MHVPHRPSPRGRSALRRLWGALQPAADALPAGYRPVLLAVLAACFVLRICIAVWMPGIHHADEVYQVAEQAHRAVHGYGIVPWEFRHAARGALFPTIVTPIYELSASAQTRQTLVAALFALASLLPVWVAFGWAARPHGLRGGMLAAIMMGTWLELVYFAPKPTPDIVSGYAFLAALFFARPAAGPRDVSLAGFCLVAALAIRMQIAPAIAMALLVIFMMGGASRRVALVAGAVAALALVGVAEWYWWGAPFRGHWNYLRMEFLHDASTFFGRQPPTFYVKNYVLMLGGAVPIVALLVLAGARIAPILLLGAAALIVPFHFIAHKEYRFLAPAFPVLVLLIALAITEFINRLDAPAARRASGLVIVGWLTAMIAMSLGDFYRPFWTKGRNQILAFREIGQDPEACGVALVGMRWYHTPGYSGLGRNIPIYELRSDADAERILAAANYVLLAPKAPVPGSAYVHWREYTRPVQSLYRRPGGCVPDENSKVVHPPGIPGIEQ